MEKIEIPKAFEDIFDPYRLKVYYGGRGGAKSETVARYLLIEGAKEPMTILCAREFQNSIKDSVHSVIADIIRSHGLEYHPVNQRGFYRILESEIRGRNGTRFIFKGLRHNIANIKSIPNIKKCWVEEAETVSDHSWKVLMPTIRGESSEIIVTFNPDIADSPTYQRMVVNAPSYALVKKVTWRDNPYFPTVLEQERTHMQENDPESYDNVWEGNPKAAVEGAVFAKQIAQTEEQGRITDVPWEPTQPVFAIFDLGRGDKTAIWFVQMIGMYYHLIDYYENNGEHFSHYIKVMKEKPYSYGRIYLPHDAKHETIGQEKSVEMQARAAFSSVMVLPRPQKKAMSIEAARSIFPMCKFDRENCIDGITALRMYAYKKDPETGKTSKDPEHDTPWSHGCLVAGTMIKTLEGEKPIETITVGEMVWTPCGYSKVTNSGPTKYARQLIEIQLGDGGKIVATPEHKFFTDKGVVHSDALRYSDCIWNQKNHRRLTLKGSPIGYRDAIMSLPPRKGKSIATFTGQFGRAIMEKYQKVFTFITKMAIPSTMTFQISNALMHSHIYQSTPRTANGTSLARMLMYYSEKPYQRQRNGIEAKREENGIENTEGTFGKIGNGKKSIVRSAKDRISLLIRQGQGTATRIVGLRHVVEEKEGRLVYDLTVERHHCYLANGVLVSNSDAFQYLGMAMRPKKEVKKKSTPKKTGWQGKLSGTR